MYLAEGLQKKWAPVLEHEDMPKIKDPYRKAVTAVLLENQEKAMKEQANSGNFGVISEAAPTNNTGDVIDRNEFRADIFIKPARSINFIQLNFIATRTGVSFSEVAGA